jgi:hypothetical protein
MASDRATAMARGMAAAALVTLLASGVSNFVDPDMWHGMALVRESLRLGHIVREDLFAYTPTIAPVVHHEWAAAMVVYLVSTSFGLAGLNALRWLLTLGIGVGAFRVARSGGATLPVVTALAPIAIFLGWLGLTAIRAQMFSLLLLVVLLAFLEADRRGGRRWIAPWLVLYVIWLNCHGGFVVGLILLAVHGVEQLARREPVKHLVVVVAACIALIGLNPWGLRYYTYLRHALVLDRSLVTEWLPLWQAAPATVPAFAVSVLVAAYALRARGLTACAGWALVAVTAAAALRHERHLSLYAVVWFCTVPAWVEQTGVGARLRAAWARPVLVATCWACVLVAGLAATSARRSFTLNLPANPGDHPTILYPVGAVSYLEDRGFRGNVMVPFNMGAYVTWRLHPAVKVSFDGRYEAAYPPEALGENVTFYARLAGWETVLHRYPTDLVLVPRRRPVAGALRSAGRWSLVYRDDAYELYARPGLYMPRVDRRGRHLVATFP